MTRTRKKRPRTAENSVVAINKRIHRLEKKMKKIKDELTRVEVDLAYELNTLFDIKHKKKTN